MVNKRKVLRSWSAEDRRKAAEKTRQKAKNAKKRNNTIKKKGKGGK